MKKINIKIIEGSTQPCTPPPCDASAGKSMKNAHYGEEARMHRSTLAHLMADAKVLINFIQDGDDLPEWLEAKITKAGDYMSAAARYISADVARDMGQLEEEVTQTLQRDDAQTKITNSLDDLKARVGNMTDEELGRVMNMLSQAAAIA